MSDTAYEWKVRTWSGENQQPSAFSEPAAFTTGLLAQSDWGNAQWIGGGKYLRKDFTVPANASKCAPKHNSSHVKSFSKAFFF
jgi:hypothetical protein